MGTHADPWITLGVIASQTERILLGTAITPIARRRPVKLAREILTLDPPARTAESSWIYWRQVF